MKKRFMLAVAIMCLLGLAVNSAFAQTKIASPPQEEPQIGIESLQLIAFYGCSIAQVGSDAKVALDGNTSTQSNVAYIAARIYLQKWTGSQWVDVTSAIVEDNNTDYVDGMYYYPVQRGYYYRARGLHLAQNGSTSEQTYSYSSSIYIN